VTKKEGGNKPFATNSAQNCVVVRVSKLCNWWVDWREVSWERKKVELIHGLSIIMFANYSVFYVDGQLWSTLCTWILATTCTLKSQEFPCSP